MYKYEGDIVSLSNKNIKVNFFGNHHEIKLNNNLSGLVTDIEVVPMLYR